MPSPEPGAIMRRREFIATLAARPLDGRSRRGRRIPQKSQRSGIWGQPMLL